MHVTILTQNEAILGTRLPPLAVAAPTDDVFWQPARKYTQSYYDYASLCPAKHDVYSVWSTEGGLSVNIGHIVYSLLFLLEL